MTINMPYIDLKSNNIAIDLLVIVYVINIKKSIGLTKKIKGTEKL